MNNIYTKPFSQIVEDVMLECREASFADTVTRAKYKRRVNDVYSRIIPARHEYDWMKKTGSFTLIPAYQTGTVTATASSTTLTGSSTVWTTAMTGRKVWISGSDTVFTFTYVSATSGTISPAFDGTTGSSLSYCIYPDTYELAADYDRMTTEPGMWYDKSRGRAYLLWLPNHVHMRRATTTPSSDPTWFHENMALSSNYLPQIEIYPPVTLAKVINYEYFRTYPEMVEFTTGSATTTLGSATVTLSADYSSYISVGQYFRTNPTDLGGDSQWSKITAISGATLTVSPVRNATLSANNYTICDAPEFPPHMTHSIFLGACMLTGLEQNDKFLMEGHGGLFNAALGGGITRQARKRYGKKVMRQDYRDFRHARY